MSRASLACVLLSVAAGCAASSLDAVRRDRCEGTVAPSVAPLSRADACTLSALEAQDAPEAMRRFVLGCENGSALACHYALASLPESRNVFLEGAGAPAAARPAVELTPPEIATLRESAARVCLAGQPALRVCVGAALLYRRVEPRDPARARELLAHRCRYAGDCALYRLGYEDRDGDGLLDRRDRCPDLAEDRDGRADEDGCPDVDEDGDGRPDDEDLCPEAAEDLDGFEDADGCPDPDDDGDGVLDAADACPREAETRNEHRDEDGCPDIAPRCACRFELAAGPEPRACASAPEDDACTFARLERDAEALLCLERTPGCPSTTLAPRPDEPIRERVLRIHETRLAVGERLRARPRSARTLRAYDAALAREAEALTLAAVRLGGAGGAAFSEEDVREAIARSTAAHEASVRALVRLAPEDREAIAPRTPAPAR